MAGENQLIQIRRAFNIPDAVTVIPGVALNRILNTNKPAKQPTFNIPASPEPDQALTYRSLLGTPVYTNIEFLGGRYETNTKGIFKEFPFQRYDAVLITVTQPKLIIKTQIQGRDGTVPEYIGMDDYRVQIQGIITGTNGHYPIEDVYQLKKMTDAPISIKVSCTYLNMLGINEIIVESTEFAQQAGGYSYQTFSIDSFSFIPQELRLSGV